MLNEIKRMEKLCLHCLEKEAVEIWENEGRKTYITIGSYCEDHANLKEKEKRHFVEDEKQNALDEAVFFFEKSNPILLEMIKDDYRPWKVRYFVNASGYTNADVYDIDFDALKSIADCVRLYAKSLEYDNMCPYYVFSDLYVRTSVGYLTYVTQDVQKFLFQNSNPVLVE